MPSVENTCVLVDLRNGGEVAHQLLIAGTKGLQLVAVSPVFSTGPSQQEALAYLFFTSATR